MKGGELSANLSNIKHKKPFSFFKDKKDFQKYISAFDDVITESGGKSVKNYEGFSFVSPHSINKWNKFIQTLETSSANGMVNLGAIESKDGPKFIVKTSISSESDRRRNHVVTA
jgi:hypothetical protein